MFAPVGRYWSVGGLIGAAVIVVVGVAVYYNSFRGDFLFDDYHSILENPIVRTLDVPDLRGPEVKRPFLQALWRKCRQLRRDRDLRPAVTLSLVLNYHFAAKDPGGNPSTWGFHLVNLVVHLSAALALFGIVRWTLRSRRLAQRFGHVATPLGLAVALIWMVHPLQAASVTYIVQRAESAMGMFFLLTLYCAIRSFGSTSGWRWAWYAGAFCACVLGMWSKQVMVTAPVIILLYDLVFVTRKGWLGRSVVACYQRSWPLYLGLLVSLYWPYEQVVRLLEDPALQSTAYTQIDMTVPTMGDYARTQFQVVLHYLRLCWWPYPQCQDYFWQPAAVTFAELYLPALLVGGLVAATLAALWKAPAMGFLGAWFFVILSPSSSIVVLADRAFEHRLYLPLAAVVALTVVGGYALCRWLVRALGRMTDLPRLALALCAGAAVGAFVAGLRTASELFTVSLGPEGSLREVLAGVLSRSAGLGAVVAGAVGALLWVWGSLGGAWRRGYGQVVGISMGTAAVAGLGLLTVLRNRTYYDEAACWRAVLASRPDHPRAHNNLGKALYFLRKDYPGEEDPKPHFARAIELLEGYADPYYNMGLVTAEEADARENLEKFRDRPEAYREFRRKKLEKAEWYYRRAIHLKPNFPQAYNNLAILLDKRSQQMRDEDPERQGELMAEAAKYFDLATQYNRHYAIAHNNLAALLKRHSNSLRNQAKQLRAEGQTAKADRTEQRAEQLRKMAWQRLERARRINPHLADVYVNMGLMLKDEGQRLKDEGKLEQAAGKLEQAVRAWQEAIRRKPELGEPHFQLAWAMMEMGQPAAAAPHFQVAAKARPGDPIIRSNLGYALYAAGEFAAAAHWYRQSLALSPGYLPALRNLAKLLATCPDQNVRNGPEAVRLARHACTLTGSRDPLYLDVLAAAYAEAGKFPQAVRAARQAVKLLQDQGNQALVEQARSRLKLYESGRALRLPAPKLPTTRPQSAGP